MTPLVSIIIPAYRCERTVADAVRSVLSGTVQDVEAIVVNDGSDDGTAEVLQKLAGTDARVKIITLEKNAGVANARNVGAREARAPWIAFLDSDDLWEPDKLAKQLALAEQTGAKLLYSAARCIDETGQPTGRFFRVPKTVSYRDALKGNDLVCSTVLIDRELFLRHPMERSDLHEDYLCWLAVLREGIVAQGDTEPLIRHRVYRNSKSGNKARSAVMAWNTYRYLGLGLFQRLRCFAGYIVHGIRRYWL